MNCGCSGKQKSFEEHILISVVASIVAILIVRKFF